MLCVRLSLTSEIELESAWQILENLNIELLYSSEDPDSGIEIYADVSDFAEIDSLLKRYAWIADIKPAILPEIDWNSQWALHGLNFQDGCVHVDLEKYGFDGSASILLHPGPGFGDLSHSTTNLVLRMMPEIVKGKAVLDVGCGSGVLSLCALKMGAKDVYGIDIEPAAIEHSKTNAKLNQMEKQLKLSLPEDFHLSKQTKSLCLLMNMIRSEQIAAWESLKRLHAVHGDCLISGILAEERNAYLEQASCWGWKLIEELQEEGWLGFHFVRT